MRVVYKRTVSERLRDSIAEADLLTKEIKCVFLTDEEASKLLQEEGLPFPRWATYHQLDGASFMGIQLRLESKQ